MKNYRGIFSKMGEQLVEKYIEDLKKRDPRKGRRFRAFVQTGRVLCKGQANRQSKGNIQKAKGDRPHQGKGAFGYDL